MKKINKNIWVLVLVLSILLIGCKKHHFSDEKLSEASIVINGLEVRLGTNKYNMIELVQYSERDFWDGSVVFEQKTDTSYEYDENEILEFVYVQFQDFDRDELLGKIMEMYGEKYTAYKKIEEMEIYKWKMEDGSCVIYKVSTNDYNYASFLMQYDSPDNEGKFWYHNDL